MTNEAADERLSTDVLVVGGGPAGTWAAIKAAEAGVDVILADKGYTGASGTTAALIQHEQTHAPTRAQPLAAELLDGVGAAEGQSAIDVGCGPRGILELLAERVGPRGRVVGLEVDPVHVAMARELVAEQGLTNVEVIHADARHTGLPPASFDVAHARAVLVNVPDPGAVLAEMTRLVRAGGWVASLEPDVAVHLYHPANPAWNRLHEISIAAFQADGADPFIGRRLPALFREAGLSDIGVRARAELFPPGHTRRPIRLDLVRSMRPKIVALGIASEQELDDLDRAAREHLDDPHTLVLPHLFFLAWGRKP